VRSQAFSLNNFRPDAAAYSLTLGGQETNFVVDLSGTATGAFATKQTLETGAVCDKRTMSSSGTVTFTAAGTAIFRTTPSPVASHVRRRVQLLVTRRKRFEESHGLLGEHLKDSHRLLEEHLITHQVH
jgi:hypothetical protein